MDCFRLNTVRLPNKIFWYPFKIHTSKLVYNYREPRLSSRGVGGLDAELKTSHWSHRKGAQNLCIVSLISDRTWYRGPTSMLFKGRRGSVLGVERQKPKVNHSHSSCTEVKNECSYTPTPSLISLHDLRRESVTFTVFHPEACTEFELCTLFLRLIMAYSL